MARSEITPQSTGAEAGLSVQFEAANVDGNSVANNGRRIVVVQSSASASRTVTQVTSGTVGGLAVADPAVTVAAGDTVVLGPWPPIYNDNDGMVLLDYDDNSSLDVAVVAVGG